MYQIVLSLLSSRWLHTRPMYSYPATSSCWDTSLSTSSVEDLREQSCSLLDNERDNERDNDWDNERDNERDAWIMNGILNRIMNDDKQPFERDPSTYDKCSLSTSVNQRTK